MKVKSIILDESFEEASFVPSQEDDTAEDFIDEMEEVEEVEAQPTISEKLNIEIEETLTPGGLKAITFISPVSRLKVMAFSPTNAILDRMTEEVVRRGAKENPYRQMMIFVSNFVCEYGNKKGEKVLSYKYVYDNLDPKEIQTIFLVISEFFRLGAI